MPPWWVWSQKGCIPPWWVWPKRGCIPPWWEDMVPRLPHTAYFASVADGEIIANTQLMSSFLFNLGSETMALQQPQTSVKTLA